jgi:F-type H+-transporting ATPase subunit c
LRQSKKLLEDPYPSGKKINNTYQNVGEKSMDKEAARLIGAGIAMIGAIGGGLGIGVLVSGAVQGIARNPEASGDIQTNMILGIAFAEAVAIYCLVVALLILFVI